MTRPTGRVDAPVPRLVALDRLRALAVLSMIQGHTFSALLAEGALPPRVMHVHAIVHGLTAPAFLFGAGLAFGVATYPQYARHHTGGPALAARLRRCLLLVVLGYALQLPGASLLAALHLTPEKQALVLRVGPLHLVALCLAISQLSALVLRDPRVHALFALALGLVVMALAPGVWSAQRGLAAGPLLGPWLDGSRGSLFPIFPWASFAFFGVACAGLHTFARDRPPRARAWLVPGLLLAGGAYLVFRAGVRLSDARWFWQSSPVHVLFRVGLVLCVLAALHRRDDAHVAPDPRSATMLLARHSLVAYVAHLLVLYGTPWTPNLAHRHAAQLGAGEATLVLVLVLAATWLAVHAWDWLTRERALAPGWVQVALTVLGVIVLVR